MSDKMAMLTFLMDNCIQTAWRRDNCKKTRFMRLPRSKTGSLTCCHVKHGLLNQIISFKTYDQSTFKRPEGLTLQKTRFMRLPRSKTGSLTSYYVKYG